MNSESTRYAIGIDVGGTSIRAGLVDELGECMSTQRCVTPIDLSAEELVDCIADLANRVRLDAKSIAITTLPIGLAVPGSFDSSRRTIVRSVNLPSSEGAELGAMLAQRYDGGTVAMMNDAEAATWGEYSAWKCAGGWGTFVHLRLGTGIACGVVQDGALVRLDEGRDTHFEVLVVEDGPEAPICLCGLTGCLEAIASGTALIKSAEIIGIADGVAGLQRAWERGERGAREVVSRAARAVRVAVGQIGDRFGPCVICMGGGVIEHLPALADGFLLGDDGDIYMTPEVKLVSAQLGDIAGIIGAALTVLNPDSHTV